MEYKVYTYSGIQGTYLQLVPKYLLTVGSKVYPYTGFQKSLFDGFLWTCGRIIKHKNFVRWRNLVYWGRQEKMNVMKTFVARNARSGGIKEWVLHIEMSRIYQSKRNKPNFLNAIYCLEKYNISLTLLTYTQWMDGTWLGNTTQCEFIHNIQINIIYLYCRLWLQFILLDGLIYRNSFLIIILHMKSKAKSMIK